MIDFIPIKTRNHRVEVVIPCVPQNFRKWPNQLRVSNCSLTLLTPSLLACLHFLYVADVISGWVITRSQVITNERYWPFVQPHVVD